MRQFVFFATLFLPLASVAEAPGSRLYRDIPDFTQTAVRGAEFGNGQQFCAPAAVSNSLIWHGAPTENQHSLVTLLASAGYMNTDLKIGTGTSELLRALTDMRQKPSEGPAHLRIRAGAGTPRSIPKIQKGLRSILSRAELRADLRPG